MKKVLLFIPFLFVMMVGSVFADAAPTTEQLTLFKNAYPGYEFSTVTMSGTYNGKSFVEKGYLAVPPGVTVSLNLIGTDLKITVSSGLVRYLTPGGYDIPQSNGSTIGSYVTSFTNVGESYQVKGVGLEKIPTQMVGVGGTVLPTVLKAFAALLIVGLVVRFRHSFRL